MKAHIPIIFSMIFFAWMLLKVKATTVYVTPHQTCGQSCNGTIEQPFDNFYFALQKASNSSVIIFLANNTVNHYFLAVEQDISDPRFQYSHWNETSFNFDTLEIKPLFCDEIGNLTIPDNTTCVERNESVTIFLKSLNISIGIKSQLKVQNIVFNGIEALADYNSDITRDYSECTNHRMRCCAPVVPQEPEEPEQPSDGVDDECFDEDDNYICPTTINCYSDSDGNDYCEECYPDRQGNQHCQTLERLMAQTQSAYNCDPTNTGGDKILLESIFRVDDPDSPTSETRQQISFINTELQSFWGKYIGSFLKAKATPYINITFENSIIEDCFFYCGLVYISGEGELYSDDPSTPRSIVTFKNMNFSDYNKWNRPGAQYIYTFLNNSYTEGYLLLVEKVFKGTLNVLDSTFENIRARSISGCMNIKSEQLNYNLVYQKMNVRTNLWDLCSAPREYDFYFGSLIYIPLMGGSMNVMNSTFRKISGIEGSVIRVEQAIERYIQYDVPTSFNFIDSTFEANSAISRFANILITHTDGYVEDCFVATIKNSKFLNASGCSGGYGNVGLMCLYNEDYFDWNIVWDNVDSPYDVPPSINVTDSVFQNNLIGLSNSLALVGSYSIMLERNIFQDNGGTTGDYLFQYSQTRVPIKRLNPPSSNPEDDYTGGFNKWTSWGQSTAVYISSFFLLQSKGNTYKGNWGPWQGSQALGSSLTLLNWSNIFTDTNHRKIVFPLNLVDDSFIDHIGVPTIIPEERVKHFNCYTPPIITLGNTYQDYGNDWTGPPDVLMKGVKFNNNIGNYPTLTGGGCDHMITDYYTPSRFTSLVDNNVRYRTGFFKFLTPSEQADHGELYENDLDPTIPDTAGEGGIDMQFLFSSGEIINNTLGSDSCMFPTLRLRYFRLENLTIEGNQINPFKETQANNTFKKQADVYDVINARAGIFCGFQKNSIIMPRNIYINIKTSQINNNIGPIINLYPDESNYLDVRNTNFTNNTCERTALIIALQGSAITSISNTFTQNKNAYGNIFITSPFSGLTDNSSTYVNNTGKHASLFYGDNKATLVQNAAKIDHNSINPVYPLFYDNVTPQGAVYFLSLASLTVRSSNFTENNVYGGLISCSGGIVILDQIQVANHLIVGIGLLGSFLYGSELTMNDANLTNNLVSANSQIEIQPSFIKAVVGKVTVSNLQISNVSEPNAAAMIYGTNIQGTFTNISMAKLNVANGNPLIGLTSSEVVVKNLNISDTTSAFTITGSKLTLDSILIQGLRSDGSSLYLINTASSTLAISKLEYIGGQDRKDFISLIVGAGNNVTVSSARYTDAVYGNNKVFELKESSLFVITGSTFEYSKSESLPLVFDLESSQNVFIHNCKFSHTGQIVQDVNTQDKFWFIGNTILADPSVKKMEFSESNAIQFIDNCFLSDSTDHKISLPESQISLTNTKALSKITNNTFISLYGSKGIIQIQSEKSPYKFSLTDNTFINNIGSYGGAIHLEANLATSSSSPEAFINTSIFLLNKAIVTSDATVGKGGALYLTTSTLTYQSTIINNSFFINNSAEVIGGALFFDYMPPKVDLASEFAENIANGNRSNHIGSYPVKLVYYEHEPESYPPALPNYLSSRFLAEPEHHQWDNIPSGIITGKNHTFALLDMYDQVVFSDNTSLLEILPTNLSKESISLFSNKPSIVAQEGLYIFDNFKFTYQVNTALNVTFSSTAIQADRQIPLNPPLIQRDSIVIETHFRRCGRGEYVLQEANTTSCVECRPGYWQTNPVPDATTCLVCDSRSTVCLGADKVGPRAGYWRLNQTANMIYQCPVTESCLGSNEDPQNVDPEGKCAYGYTGNLCSNCIAGWAKAGNGQCTDCETDTWYYLRVMLLLLAQVWVVVKAVNGTVNISKEQNQSQNLELMSSILIRILANYFQLISFVASLPVAWPGVIKSLSSATNQISSITENVFALDCMFKSDYVFGIKLVFFKALLCVVGPFALVLLGAIITAIYFSVKRRPVINNKAFSNQVIAIAVVVCFIMQPTAIQNIFFLFRCDNLYRDDSPSYYLSKDYDVQCWKGAHFYWALGFGIPSLLTWVVVLPFMVFSQVRKNKNKLQDPEVSQKYSFLYGGYTSDKYSWELMVMFRKVLLIFIIIGASFHSVNLEIYVSILLIMFWYLIHFFAHPYADVKLNRVERYALISAGVVNFCGLYFKFVSPTKALDIIIVIWGLMGNLLFLVYFGMLYLAIQIESFLESKKAKRVLTSLGLKFRWFNAEKIEKSLTKIATRINTFVVKETFGKSEKLQSMYTEGVKNKETEPIQSPTEKRLLMLSLQNESIDKVTSQERETDGEIPLPLPMRLDSLGSPGREENYDKHEVEGKDDQNESRKSEREESLYEEILNLSHILKKIPLNEKVGSQIEEI